MFFDKTLLRLKWTKVNQNVVDQNMVDQNMVDPSVANPNVVTRAERARTQ